MSPFLAVFLLEFCGDLSVTQLHASLAVYFLVGIPKMWIRTELSFLPYF